MSKEPKDYEAVDAEQTAYCVECRSTINIRALKCSHCGSYQDWRRHFGTTTSSIALIIALVPFITLTVKALLPDYSKTTVTFLRGGTQGVYFVGTNTGNKISILKGIRVIHPKWGEHYLPSEESKKQDFSIKPGEPITFTFKTNYFGHTSRDELQEDAYAECKAYADIIEYGGPESSLLITDSEECHEFWTFFITPSE